MNHEDPRQQQVSDSLQVGAPSGNEFIQELTFQEVLSVSGGPQIINDGGTMNFRELTASEILGVAGGPQITNDGVTPPP